MKTLAKIDEAIYHWERKLAGWISLGMAVVVFFDVVHRIFSRTPGRLSTFLGSNLGRDPMELETGIAPAIIFLCFWLLSFGALKTRGGYQNVGVRSLIATVVLTVIVQGFLRFVPQGLVWSPYLGLSALLWMGLLGASMATHKGQHLSMELGEKLWPKKLLKPVRLINGLVVGGFCAFLAILACTSLSDHFQDWNSGPEAGLIPAIDWPKWVVFSIIPYAFSMMALRFWAQATGLLKRPEGSS